MANKRPDKSDKTPKTNTGGRARSLQNLRPAWKRGESGNPGGRPRSRHLSKAGAEWLMAEYDKDPSRSNAEAVIEAVGLRALKGDVAAAAWLADRTEGKPRASIDITIEQKKREMVE